MTNINEYYRKHPAFNLTNFVDPNMKVARTRRNNTRPLVSINSSTMNFNRAFMKELTAENRGFTACECKFDYSNQQMIVIFKKIYDQPNQTAITFTKSGGGATSAIRIINEIKSKIATLELDKLNYTFAPEFIDSKNGIALIDFNHVYSTKDKQKKRKKIDRVAPQS